MPSATLPTFTLSQLSTHNNRKSCYVSMGEKVFDVTEFLADHPGGEDLVLQYGGADIRHILQDQISHRHSEAAYEILDEYLVGYLSEGPTTATMTKSIGGGGNGGHTKLDSTTTTRILSSNGYPKEKKEQQMEKGGGSDDGVGSDQRMDENGVYEKTGLASEDDLSVPTDLSQDFKTHKFIDLSRPMLMQVWNGGFSKDFYLDQVHRPRHMKGGASAPLFGNILEPLSKTPWWLVPVLWLPAVGYALYRAQEGVQDLRKVAGLFSCGVAAWTLLEYFMHRCLFHLDEYLPDNRVFITAHFLLHGIHHYLPMDKYRLVMPPTLFLALATPVYQLTHLAFRQYGWHVCTNLFAGGLFGYICYDLTHYFLHHKNLPSWWRGLKRYHLMHHFRDYQVGFGVTSRFWDWVFGTELVMEEERAGGKAA